MRAPDRARPSRSRRLWWRWLIGGAAALAVSAGVGVFVAPRVLRHVAEQQLGRTLGRKVTIEGLRLNPFALSLIVDGLQVQETSRSGTRSYARLRCAGRPPSGRPWPRRPRPPAGRLFVVNPFLSGGTSVVLELRTE